MNVDKKIVMIGFSSGVGIAILWVLRRYVDGKVPNPLTPLIGSWGKYSTILPITYGAILTFLPMFKSFGKYDDYMQVFGISSLVSGIFNGITDSLPVARAGMRLSANGSNGCTTCGHTARAAGYGSTPGYYNVAQVQTNFPSKVVNA